MGNKKLCAVARNIISVFVGIIVYLIVDTVVGIVAGILLINLPQLEADTIGFQVVLNYIVTASDARLIALVANHIAPRNNKGHNVSEYIISAFVIISAVVITMINLRYGTLDAKSIIFCVFSLILGRVLFLDAKEELI